MVAEIILGIILLIIYIWVDVTKFRNKRKEHDYDN